LYPKSAKTVSTLRKKDEPWWKKLIDQLVEKFKERKPLIDIDGDGFSTVQAIRGTLWRGKDCNDMHQQIHPGRKWSKEFSQVDYNCNGIHGTDGTTPYKLSLCGGGVNRGVAVIGDSGSAHFRIPEQLLNPAYMDFAHYKHILTIAESEADWPHLSWVTGYFDKDVTDLTPGPVDSIYKRMVQRNKCVHRDYQNVAVNGASSNNVLNYMQRLSRNQTTDEPLLVFFALIGNDVCGEHPGLDRQTTPEKFYANIKNGLDFLETKLPANSYGKYT
jgi:acyloxyacyl hydrolase